MQEVLTLWKLVQETER